MNSLLTRRRRLASPGDLLPKASRLRRFAVLFKGTASAPRWSALVAVFSLLALASGRLTAAETAAAEPPREALRLQRTWMPNANPSSFAVGFGSGVNFCFDPVRGNLIYAWQGDYLDLRPTTDGKNPGEPVIQGRIFHEDMTMSGFRTGSQNTSPVIRFRGYKVQKDLPEFQYEVDGILVRETIRPGPGGAGLIRQFQINTPDRAVTYQVRDANGVSIDSGQAKWQEGRLLIPGNSTAKFSVPVSPR